METGSIAENYNNFFEAGLSGRYIPLSRIEPLFGKHKKVIALDKIGSSVGGLDIHKFKIGHGKKKILMWSQMHGNESTTTKAVFDLLNFFDSDSDLSASILNECEIHIIPILNPDGAMAYTRINKNEVDLNRDAQDLSQPESRVLRSAFEEIKPDYCFNLHDQRTIFNVGKTDKPATVSFLSPAEDQERTVTSTRKKSMELIADMNNMLQQMIPGQVGRYDDSFNINCVGDTFQSMGVPTILFEAGHFPGDYKRERTREYIFYALVEALNSISHRKINGENSENYFDIPENDKLFCDIILRDFPVVRAEKMEKVDVGILFKEKRSGENILFEPYVEKVGSLHYLYAHKEFIRCDRLISPLKESDLDTKWLEDNLRIFQEN
ncbi:DUF2817 domain-containing protein [Leptobacterium flavescens]|uniref:DUF2817 domain-containing protein n=1 Tax=Leptobacterium flavescens TaxID=472055 RepID=A0A6P0ULD6_9FLAO|nr:M14 metallopeptidase family protein [Leptobacterium flavescens]NER13787.1 DUF2817 domain-containing protein [Leptobacterium flavescens]